MFAEAQAKRKPFVETIFEPVDLANLYPDTAVDLRGLE